MSWKKAKVLWEGSTVTSWGSGMVTLSPICLLGLFHSQKKREARPASCLVYRAWAVDTQAGDVAYFLTVPLRSLGRTDTCTVNRQHRSSKNEVLAISFGVLNREETLSMDWRAALATTNSDQKFSFKRKASEAPNKGVLFPQPLCFAALGSGAGGQERRW